MLNIVIIDQNPLVCLGIQALLNEMPDTKSTVRFAASTEAFEALIINANPDLAILGVYKVPAMDIPYVKDRILQACPAIPVIICYDEFVPKSIRSFSKQGVLGLIFKNKCSRELKGCVESVMKGKTYLCEETIQRITETWRAKKKTTGSKNKAFTGY